jgi:hypothetical protein
MVISFKNMLFVNMNISITSLRKSYVLRTLVILSSVILLATACKKEPVRGCTDVYSENYDSLATEDDGTCFYSFEKFIDTYTVTESCTPASNLSYEMEIYSVTNLGNSIIMKNLGGFNNGSFNGVVDGNSLNIPNQTHNISGNSVTVSGSGTINANTLTISYTYNVGGSTGSCTATCIK